MVDSRAVSLRRRGFTMLEMLTVLGIIGVLFGISAGVFRRSVPRRELARNAVVDSVRRARVFSVAERSDSVVFLTQGTDEDWPSVTAIGRRGVGVWHLEGDDLGGFPTSASGQGYDIEPRGAIGKALRLSEEQSSYVDLGHAGSFESSQGIACSLFVKLTRAGDRMLMSKGRAFEFECDASGFVQARVNCLVRDQDEEWTESYHSVTSDRPVLPLGRWVEIGFTFDGLVLRLRADGGVAGELVLTDWTECVPEIGAPLMIGSPNTPFAGSVDEVKWGVYRATEQQLVDMTVTGPSWVRFAPGGVLDSRFHQGPVELALTDESGLPLLVSVGVFGDVN